MDINTLFNKLLSIKDEVEISIYHRKYLISQKNTYIDNIIKHNDYLILFCDDAELQISAPDIIEEDGEGALIVRIGELSIEIEKD